MNERRRLAGDWVIKGGGEACRKLLGFVITAVAARKLGSDGFGEYTSWFTAANMAALVFDFGLNTVMIREIARKRETEGAVVAAVAGIRVVLGILMAALVIGLTAVWNQSPEASAALYFLSAFWVATISVEMIGAVFAGRRSFRGEALVLVLQKLLLALAVGVGFGLHAGLRGFVLVHPIAAVLGLGLSIEYLRRCEFRLARPTCAQVRYLFREAMPLALSLGFTLLYFKVDILLLRWLTTAEQVGLYGAAFRVLELAMAVPATLTAVLFPVMSAKVLEGTWPRFVKESLLFSMGLGLLGASVLGVCSAWLIETIYGEAFRSSAPVLAALSFGLALIFGNYILIFTLIALGRQKVNAVMSGLCLVINLALNLIAIPVWGGIGAAVTTVLTELVLFAVSLYFCGIFSKVPGSQESEDQDLRSGS